IWVSASRRPERWGQWSPPSTEGLARSLIRIPTLEQPELHRVAVRLRQAEMPEGVRRQHAATGGALHEALLDQVGFDDLLDGVSRLGQGRRHGLDPDRAAAERL